MKTFSKNIAEARTQDYLYDPHNYHVSGAADHQKSVAQSNSTSQFNRLSIDPIFKNMFSAMPRVYPPKAYTFNVERPSELMTQNHAERVAPHYAPKTGIVNTNYVHRANVPMHRGEPVLPPPGSNILYAKVTKAELISQSRKLVAPKIKTVSVQTMYRESSAQTEPYSPDYTISANLPPPEILVLSTMTFNAGLPIGPEGIEMIERARIKRAWEAQMPQGNDQATFIKRFRMMEQMELKEWADRDEEIRKIQNARLKLLETALRAREASNEVMNNERLETMWVRKLQQRDSAFEEIEKKRMRGIRKLAERRKKIDVYFTGKGNKRDIIEEYGNYASKVHSKVLQGGEVMTQARMEFMEQVSDMQSFKKLDQLQRGIGASAFEESRRRAQNALESTKIRSSSVSVNPGPPHSSKQDIKFQNEMRILQECLRRKAEGRTEGDAQDTQRFVQHRPDVNYRPQTIQESIMPLSSRRQELEQSAILLQKLIRGRIRQKEMTHGKGLRQSLINELRIREKLQQVRGDVDTSTVKLERPNGAAPSSRSGIPSSARSDISIIKRRSAGPIQSSHTPATSRTGTTTPQPLAPALPDGSAGETETEPVVVEIAQRLKAAASAGTAVHRASDSETDEEAEREYQMQLRYLHQLDAPGASRSGRGGRLTPLSNPVSAISSSTSTPTSRLTPLPLPDITAVTHEYVGKTLAFLTKELVRLRQERAIAAVVKLAERTRRIREHQETARRGVEARARGVQEEVWTQIADVHELPVDSFLYDVIARGMNAVGGQQAREHVEQCVQRVGAVIEELVENDRCGTGASGVERQLSASSVAGAGLDNVSAHGVSASSLVQQQGSEMSLAASQDLGISATSINGIGEPEESAAGADDLIPANEAHQEDRDADIVDDLVNSFTLAYVQSETRRDTEKLHEAKFARVAHQIARRALVTRVEPVAEMHHSAERHQKEARAKDQADRADASEQRRFRQHIKEAGNAGLGQDEGDEGDLVQRAMDLLIDDDEDDDDEEDADSL
ncbi:MAG: hypothetical protein SGCHY_001896 [Lobulomycetales sp.]